MFRYQFNFLSVSPCLSVSDSLSLCLSFSLSLSVCLNVCLSVCLSLSLSFSLTNFFPLWKRCVPFFFNLALETAFFLIRVFCVLKTRAFRSGNCIYVTFLKWSMLWNLADLLYPFFFSFFFSRRFSFQVFKSTNNIKFVSRAHKWLGSPMTNWFAA